MPLVAHGGPRSLSCVLAPLRCIGLRPPILALSLRISRYGWVSGSESLKVSDEASLLQVLSRFAAALGASAARIFGLASFH